MSKLAMLTFFLKPLFLVVSWWASVVCAWWVLSQAVFFYPLWYTLLDIDKTIATYAPQNRFGKTNFQYTSIEERQRLFADIAYGVNHQGKGLHAIGYQLPESSADQTYPLLTQAELLHLYDVAHWVGLLKTSGLRAAVLAFMGVLLLRITQSSVQSSAPRVKSSLQASGLFIISAIAITALLGWERSFYWLHEQLFPPGHQWFFYYQDSLMSTLMQAPNLFLPIALVWLLMAYSLWVLVIMCCSYMLAGQKKPDSSRV